MKIYYNKLLPIVGILCILLCIWSFVSLSGDLSFLLAMLFYTLYSIVVYKINMISYNLVLTYFRLNSRGTKEEINQFLIQDEVEIEDKYLNKILKKLKKKGFIEEQNGVWEKIKECEKISFFAILF